MKSTLPKICPVLYRVDVPMLRAMIVAHARGDNYENGLFDDPPTKLPPALSCSFVAFLPSYADTMERGPHTRLEGPFTIVVRPTVTPRNGHKSSAHRIHVRCDCGRLVPVGRIAQHKHDAKFLKI